MITFQSKVTKADTLCQQKPCKCSNLEKWMHGWMDGWDNKLGSFFLYLFNLFLLSATRLGYRSDQIGSSLIMELTVHWGENGLK